MKLRKLSCVLFGLIIIGIFCSMIRPATPNNKVVSVQTDSNKTTQSYNTQTASSNQPYSTKTTSSNQQTKIQKTVKNIQGKVVKIADGDTVTVLMNNRQYKIRLAGIDAPEKGQPYSQKSREYLAAMVAGERVSVKVINKDKYGRYVGKIQTDNIKDVNGEMLKAGLAWHYRYFDKSTEYAEYEEQARQQNLGLWQDKAKQIPPWEYRKQMKGRRNVS